MSSHSDSFDVCKMSNIGKSLKMKLSLEANKSLKLKSKTGSISFPLLGKSVGWNIVCYSSATYVSLEDESPPGGLIIFACGRMNRMAPICWSSKKT